MSPRKSSIKSEAKIATPAKKIAAVKKVAVKKIVEAKAPVSVGKKATKKCACEMSVSAATCGGLTRIIAKFDAGWGNSLYIRGNGAGLSWQKGVLMQCVDTDEWVWENKIAKGSVEFKILINDEIWNAGDDMSIKAGETFSLHPQF